MQPKFTLAKLEFYQDDVKNDLRSLLAYPNGTLSLAASLCPFVAHLYIKGRPTELFIFFLLKSLVQYNTLNLIEFRGVEAHSDT